MDLQSDALPSELSDAVVTYTHMHTYTHIHTNIFYLLEQVVKADSNIADVDLLVKPRDNRIDRPNK